MLRFLVALKFALFVEMFVANDARVLVFPLAVVNFVFVALQVVLVLEDTSTQITVKSAGFTVLSRNVQVKRGSACLAKRARGTLEVSQSKVDIFMVRFQVVLGFQSLFTLAARESFPVKMTMSVSFKVTFGLELFAADVTGFHQSP